jgi:transketolase
VAPLLRTTGGSLPRCEANASRCNGGQAEEVVEECFWEALEVVRDSLQRSPSLVSLLAHRLRESRDRLVRLRRKPRDGAPRLEAVYETARTFLDGADGPPRPESVTTLRGELGNVLNLYNRASGGALLAAAADLLGSTSVSQVAAGFPEGYFNARTRPGARLLSIGGICEDAMAGMLSGLSCYGRHMGIGSSYGAFVAPLGHIAARLHAIGCQARQNAAGEAYRPFFLICAHAGLKTGEDGPTHADPQPLQLLQGNFPPRTLITLTPWEPREIGFLVAAALLERPAVIAPFVTRPSERVPDRKKLGLSPAGAATTGLYLLRKAAGKGDGTVVLQESGVTYAFVEQALPLLEKKGIDLNVYYVASAELFDLLPAPERDRIYPEALAREAMGITGFTLPTMHRWITSERGRSMTLHPFMKGHFLGSGQAEKVLCEAGLDGESQFRAVVKFLELGRSRVA